MKNIESKESIKSIPSNRLQFFPVMMFAIVMGLSGLSLVFKKLSEVLYFPSIIGTLFTLISTIVFFLILGNYILKLLKYKKEVKEEIIHPIRINFFVTYNIDFLSNEVLDKQ